MNIGKKFSFAALTVLTSASVFAGDPQGTTTKPVKQEYQVSEVGQKWLDAVNGKARIYSPEEADELSLKKPVMHYGVGAEDAILTAESLNRQGFETTAVAGGPPGQVELIFKKRGKIFEESEAGRMGSLVKRYYPRLYGPPVKHEENKSPNERKVSNSSQP